MRLPRHFVPRSDKKGASRSDSGGLAIREKILYEKIESFCH